MAELLIGTEPVTALIDGWEIRDRRSLVDSSGREWLSSPQKLTAMTTLGDAVFLGTGAGEVLRFDGEEHAVPGFDRVPGRETWHAVGSSKPYVRSMSTSRDGVLFANVHVGGIPRSTDGGETWEPTIDVDADIHQVLAHPERADVVVAAAAVGLAISEDAGKTWAVHTDGFHGTYARAVAVAGDTVYVSASTGPFTHEGAVYRGSPAATGMTLERVSDFLDGNVDSGRLAAFGDQVAFGGPDGRLHISDDRGATWTVRGGVESVTALAYSRT